MLYILCTFACFILSLVPTTVYVNKNICAHTYTIHMPEWMCHIEQIESSNDDVRKDERARFESELKRMQEMDEVERTVLVLKRTIEDTILTKRCPRCQQAFHDFDGCFALTCSNKRCKAAFCAWCLTDCGLDAHAHVAHCNLGNGDVHGNRVALTNVWKRTNRDLIILLMKDKPTAIKRKLQEVMGQVFRDDLDGLEIL